MPATAHIRAEDQVGFGLATSGTVQWAKQTSTGQDERSPPYVPSGALFPILCTTCHQSPDQRQCTLQGTGFRLRHDPCFSGTHFAPNDTQHRKEVTEKGGHRERRGSRGWSPLYLYNYTKGCRVCLVTKAHSTWSWVRAVDYSFRLPFEVGVDHWMWLWSVSIHEYQ